MDRPSYQWAYDREMVGYQGIGSISQLYQRHFQQLNQNNDGLRAGR